MQNRIIIYILLVVLGTLIALLAFSFGVNWGFLTSIDKYNHEIVPTLYMIGTWVAALGTCSAVIFSLWLSFKQFSRDKDIIDCQLNINVIPTHQDIPCIGLSIVSKGNRPANVT